MRRHEHIRQEWKGRGEACRQHWKRKQDPGGTLGDREKAVTLYMQFGKLHPFTG